MNRLDGVSVVIPTWNGARLLQSCLEALSRLDEWGDFEVVVVDDASTDATSDLAQSFPSVVWHRQSRNRGFAAAVNRGIRESHGEVVVLLNNDTEVTSGWLAALVSAFVERPQVGMATSKLLVHGRPGPVIHTTGDVVGLDGFARNRGVWEIDRGQYDELTEVFGASAAAGAYRRAVFDDVGLFEETFESYLEDVDLAWRARLAGWECTFCPAAVVYHHVSATGGGAYASYRVARNRSWLIARNYPTRLLVRHWTKIGRAQIQEARRAAVAFRGTEARATLRGLVAGWVSWPRMLSARSRIQSGRRIDLAKLEALMADEYPK